jgi:hypothetical protein
MGYEPSTLARSVIDGYAIVDGMMTYASRKDAYK